MIQQILMFQFLEDMDRCIVGQRTLSEQTTEERHAVDRRSLIRTLFLQDPICDQLEFDPILDQRVSDVGLHSFVVHECHEIVDLVEPGQCHLQWSELPAGNVVLIDHSKRDQ